MDFGKVAETLFGRLAEQHKDRIDEVYRALSEPLIEDFLLPLEVREEQAWGEAWEEGYFVFRRQKTLASSPSGRVFLEARLELAEKNQVSWTIEVQAFLSRLGEERDHRLWELRVSRSRGIEVFCSSIPYWNLGRDPRVLPAAVELFYGLIRQAEEWVEERKKIRQSPEFQAAQEWVRAQLVLSEGEGA